MGRLLNLFEKLEASAKHALHQFLRILCLNFQCQNASYFTNLYVDNEFVTFVNSCSRLNSVEFANIRNFNVSTKSNSANSNGSTLNKSLITNLLCINSGLNQNLTIISNQLNLSLNCNVFIKLKT